MNGFFKSSIFRFNQMSRFFIFKKIDSLKLPIRTVQMCEAEAIHSIVCYILVHKQGNFVTFFDDIFCVSGRTWRTVASKTSFIWQMERAPEIR